MNDALPVTGNVHGNHQQFPNTVGELFGNEIGHPDQRAALIACEHLMAAAGDKATRAGVSETTTGRIRDAPGMWFPSFFTISSSRLVLELVTLELTRTPQPFAAYRPEPCHTPFAVLLSPIEVATPDEKLRHERPRSKRHFSEACREYFCASAARGGRANSANLSKNCPGAVKGHIYFNLLTPRKRRSTDWLRAWIKSGRAVQHFRQSAHLIRCYRLAGGCPGQFVW